MAVYSKVYQTKAMQDFDKSVDPASANPSRYPSWVLLDSRAYFAHPINATTVKATTSTGHNFENWHIEHLRLLRLQGCLQQAHHQIGPVSSSNLQALMACSHRIPRGWQFFGRRSFPGSGPWALQPAYLLVGDRQWSTQHVQLKEHPGILPKLTHKVISLGEGTVGWVDLWRGIVVCDVLQKDPVLRFIPLPRPLPKADYDEPPESQALADYDARSVRDVTGFPNGFIDFIEIEHCFKWSKFINMRSFKTTAYLDFLDTISDNDLLRYHEEDIMEDKIKCAPDGWKIRTGFRSISWNHWRKGYNFHVDDISAEPQLALQLLHLWDSRTEKCRVRNLKTTPGFPTFTIYGRAIVLMSKQVAAESAQNEEVAAESAQNGVPNDQLPLGDTVPNNVQPQQYKWNGGVPIRTSNEYGFGEHQDDYQQLPSLTQTGQHTSSSTSTQLVPSSEMCKLTMVPPLMPPRPVQLAQPLRSKWTWDNEAAQSMVDIEQSLCGSHLKDGLLNLLGRIPLERKAGLQGSMY
uniref:DUF1618 domain-containing protein n=1 Tax=Aegilops tauschii TaxID=37682 RepID=N1QSD7_AEGTA